MACHSFALTRCPVVDFALSVTTHRQRRVGDAPLVTVTYRGICLRTCCAALCFACRLPDISGHPKPTPPTVLFFARPAAWTASCPCARRPPAHPTSHLHTRLHAPVPGYQRHRTPVPGVALCTKRLARPPVLAGAAIPVSHTFLPPFRHGSLAVVPLGRCWMLRHLPAFWANGTRGFSALLPHTVTGFWTAHEPWTVRTNERAGIPPTNCLATLHR